MPKNEPWKCPDPNCDTPCANKLSLKHHVNAKHKKIEKFECTKCKHRCYAKFTARLHVGVVHLGKNRNDYNYYNQTEETLNETDNLIYDLKNHALLTAIPEKQLALKKTLRKFLETVKKLNPQNVLKGKFLGESFDWNKAREVENEMGKKYYTENKEKSWQKDRRKNYIYLLLDPEITTKLIHQYENDENELVTLTTFISAIFYIGKGIGFRAFEHETATFVTVSIIIWY